MKNVCCGEVARVGLALCQAEGKTVERRIIRVHQLRKRVRPHTEKEAVRSGIIPEEMPRVESSTPNLGLMLRVLLPPNLAAAAARDAIAVKVELDPGPPPPELAEVLAWIQRQVGAPAKPPLFLQLTRAQLRELILFTEDQPVFFWVNRPGQPLAGRDGAIPGVSEHLEEPEPLAPPPAPEIPPPRIPRPKSRAASSAPRADRGWQRTLPRPDAPVPGAPGLRRSARAGAKARLHPGTIQRALVAAGPPQGAQLPRRTLGAPARALRRAVHPEL